MFAVCMIAVPVMGAPPAAGDWQLIWSDEFDSGPTPIPPDSSNWGYEIGYVRNQEWQYYTNNIQNAYCQDGFLHVEAHEHPPGTYPTGGYTGQDGSISSASLRSMNKVAHKYGYLEIRARIDTQWGSWPAFWSLGISGEWPDNGECDIMEYYKNKLSFNVAWWKTGDGPWSPRWDSETINVSSLPPTWVNEFHTWAMEWDPFQVRLYMDDVLYNTWDSSQDDNGGGDVSIEGFQQPHYMLINQAIGGTAGGDASGVVYPTNYEVDWVRWYQDASEPPPYILMGHWKLDESHPSSIAIDSSINRYDGTLYGGPVWNPNGRIDGALNFDGFDDYVKIKGWRGVSGINSRTVCAWIKTDMTSVGEIVSWGGTGNGEKWLLMLLSTGEPRLAVAGGGVGATTQINDGNWHHVAAVFENDGSPDVSDVKLYVDGIEEGTTSSSQVINTASYYKVKIGAYFDGLIDDVRIYKTALSRDQILFIMEGGFEYNRCIYVDDDATGANDGSSWQDAYNYLQDALSTEWWVDEIRVAQGIYKPDQSDGITPGDREATFQLKNGVTIKGSYAGFGEPDPNARDIEAYETILSGDLAGNDGPDFANNGENSYHVVIGNGTDETAVLDGFTITAGNANGSSWPTGWGGGMFNEWGNPTLTNCIFSDNSAKNGAGMHNNESDPIINNCTFSRNSVSESAGGMDNVRSSPTITNCTFSANSAQWGGGMTNWNNSSPTLTNCTFSDNSAGEAGGGMNNANDDDNDSSPTLTNCTFSDNSAGNVGGGMHNHESSPTLTDCTFINNSAGEAGGGMNNSTNSNSTVNNCTFSGNSAEHGGGMLNHECSPTVTNCIFSGNSADGSGGGLNNSFNGNSTVTNCIFTGNSAGGVGGGMHNHESSPTATNCTFSGNSARWEGGGMSNFWVSSPTLNNCILWGNTASSGPQIYKDGTSSATVSYSDVQGGWLGAGNINADPMFVGPKIGEPPESAIAHWKLDERRGSTAYDSAGENDGIVYGAQWTTGKADGALSFDGSDDWVSISNPGTISSESDFTWVAWIQTSSDTGAILARAGTGWAWERGGKVFFLRGGSLHFDVGWVGVVSSGVPVNDGQWHYVVVTVEFVNDSDTISFYVDGVSAGGGNLNVDRFSDSGLPLKIGFCNGDFPESCHFNGIIDDVRIYDRALSAEEIRQFYQMDYHLLPASPCIDAGDNTAVPAGVTTDLDGNPRFVDQPEVPDTGNGTAPIVDMGAYEADYIEVAMKLTPQALNLDSQGKWVKAHFVLPEEFLPEDVDANTPAVIAPFGIESDYINIFINDDGLVEIEAAFSRSDFCSSATSDDVTEVIVIGLLNDGWNFYGTDTIKIITKDLAVLAYYWLESDCGPPDWCGGLDRDRDSVVNFVDFALFDGCCIEVIEE